MANEDERFDEQRTGHFEKTPGENVVGTVREKHEIVFDEPETLPVGAGDDEHPSPVDYMFASLIGCQISVLDQALEKARVEDFRIVADARITSDSIGEEDVPEEMPENTGTRIEHIEVDLTVEVPEAYESRANRCLDVYDQGCIVGQSFRAGIEYTPTTDLRLADE